jgi:hypothetical protein
VGYDPGESCSAGSKCGSFKDCDFSTAGNDSSQRQKDRKSGLTFEPALLAGVQHWRVRRMATKIAVEYSAEEKQRIIAALRLAAVAQAELWDVLRDVEMTHAISIEIDGELIAMLAADCKCPPCFDDLKAERVWKGFEEHSEVSA